MRHVALVMVLLLLVVSLPNPIDVLAGELTGPIAIVSNSIDRPTAERMERLLERRGLDVVIFSPFEIESAIRYGQVIVILGGHKAPEGIGKFVSQFLTDEEKAKLERKGFGYFFFKRAPGGKPLVIVAGNTRLETHRAAMTFLVKGIELVEKYYFKGPSVALVIPAGLPGG